MDDVAEEVHISSYYLQKGFSIMTGYTISEYIRCRRLYLAALDVIAGKERGLDLAYKYGYETPESFTKAFSRFHGASPAQIKGKTSGIKPFLPLKVIVEIKGGTDMDVTVEKMNGFQIIGFERVFETEDAYEKIPKFWEEYRDNYLLPLLIGGKQPENETERTVSECCVGSMPGALQSVNTQIFKEWLPGEADDIISITVL